MMCAGTPGPTKLLSNYTRGKRRRLKVKSSIVLLSANFPLRDEMPKLRGFSDSKSFVYLLEEPTIGLHMADVAELLKVFHRLVDDGHTVIVIEHDLSVIADADYVVDIGPEAGAFGGELVANGTPEDIVKSKESRTAPFLAKLLRRTSASKPRSTRRASSRSEKAVSSF